MNRRELLTSTLVTAAAGALGLKVAPAASAAQETVAAGASHRVADLLIGDVPYQLWASPGVGKSRMVRKVAEARGMAVVDFPLHTLII